MEQTGIINMDAAMTGGCQCGAIRYRLAKPPLRTTLCHCRMCQKAVGQPFAAYATVNLDDFAWTRAQPSLFRSSTAAERHFCAACGTSLTFRYLHEDAIGVAAGTLDHPEILAPDSEDGVESRLPWMPPLEKLLQRPTDEPGAPRQVLHLVNYQHPDHDTSPDWHPPADAG